MRLCHGPLRGMFDAPTSAGEEVWDAPGHLPGHLQRRRRTRAARTWRSRSRWSARPRSWTRGACSAPLQAQRAGVQAQKTIRVNDEAWRALPIAGLGDYYQAAFKLGTPDRRAALDGAAPPLRPRRRRRRGHPPAGARQGPAGRDGDRHRLPPAPRGGPARATSALGLSATEAQRIGHYPQGVALWRIGGRSYEVRHLRSAAGARR